MVIYYCPYVLILEYLFYFFKFSDIINRWWEILPLNNTEGEKLVANFCLYNFSYNHHCYHFIIYSSKKTLSKYWIPSVLLIGISFVTAVASFFTLDGWESMSFFFMFICITIGSLIGTAISMLLN